MNRLTSFVFIAIIYFTFFACNNKEVKKQLYENGNIELEYEYQVSSGLKDGFYRVYSRDGKLKYDGNYKLGYRTGWHIMYYTNGKPHLRSFWEIRSGKELVTKKQNYDEQGHLIFDFVFRRKRISKEIIGDSICHVGDTLVIKLKIEDAEYPYCETTIGAFDEGLNVLKYSPEEPIYISGNLRHEMRCRIQFQNAGIDTVKWLIRDFNIRYDKDSVETTYGTESYFSTNITVLAR